MVLRVRGSVKLFYLWGRPVGHRGLHDGFRKRQHVRRVRRTAVSIRTVIVVVVTVLVQAVVISCFSLFLPELPKFLHELLMSFLLFTNELILLLQLNVLLFQLSLKTSQLLCGINAVHTSGGHHRESSLSAPRWAPKCFGINCRTERSNLDDVACCLSICFSCSEPYALCLPQPFGSSSSFGRRGEVPEKALRRSS